MRKIKTEVTENSKRLVIELAKSLDIDFPKDKTCKDCFHYDYGDRNMSVALSEIIKDVLSKIPTLETRINILSTKISNISSSGGG